MDQYRKSSDEYIDTPTFNIDNHTYEFAYNYSLETQDEPDSKYIEVGCVVEGMNRATGAKYRELMWNSETCVRVRESCYDIDSQERKLLTCESKWDDNGQLLSIQHFDRDFCAITVDDDCNVIEEVVVQSDNKSVVCNSVLDGDCVRYHKTTIYYRNGDKISTLEEYSSDPWTD